MQSLTAKQYLAIQAAIAAMDDAAYADAIYTDTQELVEIGWNAAKKLLDLSTGFDVVPIWALDKIQDAADNISQTLVDRDKQTLTDILDKAFVDGDSAKQVAAALRAAFANGITIYGDDGTVESVQKADSWFETVARTEMQRAAVQGQLALYQAAGIAKVRWDVAQPCDECAEADGVVLPLGDNFPGVDIDAPPAHPNCRCVLTPADEDLGDYRGDSSEDDS